MYKKYIFFDIDGTLTNHNPGGIILPSTLETLEKLKNNNYFVAIATGRNYTMAKEKMIEAHIDNAVVAGGNGLIINNEVKYIKPLDKDKALMIINECIEKDILFVVNIDDSLTAYTHTNKIYETDAGLTDFLTIKVIENCRYEDFDEIHKIHILINDKEEDKLTSLNKTGLHYARYHPLSLIVEPDDKYQGIKDMVQQLGGSLDDVVVFGDGHNDLSMMKQAEVSIAMGNAIDELKSIATFVTKDCDKDGIKYACEYFGWI
jgi:hypothetical protein